MTPTPDAMRRAEQISRKLFPHRWDSEGFKSWVDMVAAEIDDACTTAVELKKSWCLDAITDAFREGVATEREACAVSGFTDADLKRCKEIYATTESTCDNALIRALIARLEAAENPGRQLPHEAYQCGRSCERCSADKVWRKSKGE